ncbi:DUF1365 family protein [Tsukamurella sp. 8F]|uniref:DUF1365 domain-containing protein n=1 Tax=Tsukamurella sp. 8F TaxID=3031961 RepID=UPI0023B9A57B|nr:DUF1365 family protein [Tsukamurella sp. 8F]MDF0586117.1 DUF1365 family protein [Tsukamurella sp. 8F]
MTAPCLYYTEIGHVRRSPVHHAFAYRSASWFIDVDQQPRFPLWLRPLVGFRAADHLWAAPDGADTLRSRVDAVLNARGIAPPGGAVTALLGARCLGYVFDPLSIFWCHDRAGEVRVVVAEVHNTYGGRHAYVLDAAAVTGVTVDKVFYVSPFNPVEGTYRLRMPEPDERIDVDVVLDRPGQAPFVAVWRGTRRRATPARVVLAQARAPLAPIVVALRIRLQGIRLRLAGLPIVPRVRSYPRTSASASTTNGRGPRER